MFLNSLQQAAVGNQVSDNSEQQDPFLDYFLQVLYDVTYHPGHFEPMCSQLMSTLESTPNLDEQTIKLMVESLISQVNLGMVGRLIGDWSVLF